MTPPPSLLHTAMTGQRRTRFSGRPVTVSGFALAGYILRSNIMDSWGEVRSRNQFTVSSSRSFSFQAHDETRRLDCWWSFANSKHYLVTILVFLLQTKHTYEENQLDEHRLNHWPTFPSNSLTGISILGEVCSTVIFKCSSISPSRRCSLYLRK